MDRCTGHCCRAFSLEFSHEQMKVMYKRALAERGRRRAQGEDVAALDTVKVYPLLVPLNGGLRGKHPDGPRRQSDTRYWYTCKAYKDGQCTNYEHRPNMCRDYPEYNYRGLCGYKGCTWDGHHGVRARGLKVLQDGRCGKPVESEQLKYAEAAEDS